MRWFPGGSYTVEKLFREHYAERYLAYSTGTFRDIPDRRLFFDKVSTQIPAGWQEATVDAIVTASSDGRRIVVKAVNYRSERNTLLVRLQGKEVPMRGVMKVYTIAAGETSVASMEHPEVFAPVARSMEYSANFSLVLEPYSVAVVEIRDE